MCQVLLKSFTYTRLFNFHSDPVRNDDYLHFSDVESDTSKFKQLVSLILRVLSCRGSQNAAPGPEASVSFGSNKFVREADSQASPQICRMRNLGG